MISSKLVIPISFLILKNFCFYTLIRRKKVPPVLLIFIYYLQTVLAIYLNVKFNENKHDSLNKALPILINLDFLFYLFYFVSISYFKLSKNIFKTNLINPLAFFIKPFNDGENLKRNYILITIIEVIIVVLVVIKN